jgi:hypothetical protein
VGRASSPGIRASGHRLRPSKFRHRQRRSTWPLGYPRHPCAASRSGRAARVPRPTGKELRTYRTCGLVHHHSRHSAFRASLSGEPLWGRCGPQLACGRRSVVLASWAGAVWCSHPTSEDIAALVRHTVHHPHACWDTPRGLPADMGRSSMVGVGVRAVVATARNGSRATYTCKVSRVSGKTSLLGSWVNRGNPSPTSRSKLSSCPLTVSLFSVKVKTELVSPPGGGGKEARRVWLVSLPSTLIELRGSENSWSA